MQTYLALYEKVTTLAHLGLWERNLNTGEIYWNQVAQEIYETEADFQPTLDKTFAFYVDREALKFLFEKTIETGNPESGEFQLRTFTGRLKWVKLRMQMEAKAGNDAIIYGSIKDISDQRHLLDTLAEREQQFHHAFDFAPIGMALVSLTGAWIRVNRMLCEMLGYEMKDFLNKTFQDITYPDDLDLDLSQMNMLLEGKIPAYSMEKRYYRIDKQVIWVLLSVTLVRDQQNVPLYFVSQIKDINERKNMELERDKALEIIQTQNGRLLNFAHIVSHNLRSHAANIQMITSMIGEEEDLAEQENLISLLGVNALNLQETLEHLNEVVDVGSDGAENQKTLNLLNEINKVKNVLLPSLQQVNAKLVIQVAPEIVIATDQAYLESILLNLLTNSIKYRKPNRNLQINVLAKLEKNKLVLKIKDNGLGIDLGVNGSKIFGMYNTFHGNKDARGIGLFLVKNQVEGMRGTISVKSKPAVGTTFEIVLPINEKD
ncbi:PAS domain S-box protein [Mucilaginibacter sp. E4BP6]|uniref:sensor histidine kinase n=1 Tax=Mucilaginibacter sp. E4BP6 TaxID=2723089 RepID=UPI0015CDEBEE|nr:HAMP domain-containing sensor histidine kinase [Mucilaginibacter sp. E4BP6]NYE64595.1 PAS domain S-box-containing protein [Mucilaginibacter sp. E4BP6]